MSEYSIRFHEFLLDYIKILLKMYRDARIELYMRDRYYYILIGFRYIEEGWVNHIDRVEIVDADRKYLLILLGKVLMSYIVMKR